MQVTMQDCHVCLQDSSSTGSSDSPVSAGPVTPAKLHFESSQHLPSKSEISPQHIASAYSKVSSQGQLKQHLSFMYCHAAVT